METRSQVSSESQAGNRALAEIEAHLAFKAALFDTSNDGAQLPLPPVNFGRCFRPMGVVEAQAICANYNEWLHRWTETGEEHWPLATRIANGTNSALCFKLRTGARRTCWMYDGGGLIKFRGQMGSCYYPPCDVPLADRFLTDASRVKWAGWYVPKYPRRIEKMGLERDEQQQVQSILRARGQ